MAEMGDALERLASFPLLEALYGRRSRRFPLGGEIPDGPLAYRSEHEAMPLSELERNLVLSAMGGTTGWHYAITRHERYAPHFSNYAGGAAGRTFPSAAGFHTAELFFTDDSGTYFFPTRDAGALVDPAVEELTPELMIERHVARIRKLSPTRIHLPRAEPYMEGHNTWIANAPGSLLVIPVADIAQHAIANLCFFTQNGYSVYDDVNGARIPGMERFRSLVDVDEPLPLTFLEQYSLTEATAELATSAFAGTLVLQAMGLGGWMFDGIERLTMLGASGDPDVPGLGFRYDEDERWSMPNPTGLPGVFEAFCPPHYPDMRAAVEALAERKFGPGRRVQPRDAGRLERERPHPRRGAAVHGGVQGVRRRAGAVRLRHLRQVPRHGAVALHHELRAGPAPRHRLLRPLLPPGRLPLDACRAHARLAPRARAMKQFPGPTNSIVDVEGIEVGHATRNDAPFLTGVTVVLAREGAIGGVDVRGGGPGTRETDVLDPRNLVERVHAVLLAGGSAYGLDAATGVMSALEQQGIGFRVGPLAHEIVPIVPAAVLYDLGRGGDFRARPDAGFGADAVAAASGERPAQGSVGAGTGAVAGRLKGGIGTASCLFENGAVVGALVAVNAFGDAVSPETGEPYGAFAELEGEFGETLRHMTLRAMPRRGATAEPRQPFNTTIGVVATNVRLDKAQAQKFAGAGQTGMARAIRPVHTLFDGDTVFGLSTAREPLADGSDDPLARAVALNDLYAAAADTFTRAIVHALIAAETVGEWRGYRDS